MGILYIEGKADESHFFRVAEEFRAVFGGEVSSQAFTLKHPKNRQQQEFFCMKLDVEEIDNMSSFTKLKIERALKNLTQGENRHFFKEMKRLETTPDLEHIFSLNLSPSSTKNQQEVKEEIQHRKAESSPSPTTSTETRSTYPSYDELSDLSDDEDDDKYNLPRF